MGRLIPICCVLSGIISQRLERDRVNHDFSSGRLRLPAPRAEFTVLNEVGYGDVCAFESAYQLFDFLRAQGANVASEVDLILLDKNMPGLSGVEACETIKRAAHLKDISVIIVTASHDLDTLKEAFSVGVNDYIIKPPSKAELTARVRAALQLKHETDQRKARERELEGLMAELREANKQLQGLSFLDGLTGIANRRRFDEVLGLEWRRAVRQQGSLSLIFCDIDAFKPYNDGYGHQQGDECLVNVAQALAEQYPHRAGRLSCSLRRRRVRGGFAQYRYSRRGGGRGEAAPHGRSALLASRILAARRRRHAQPWRGDDYAARQRRPRQLRQSSRPRPLRSEAGG